MDADMRILRELILRQSESAQKKEDSKNDLSKMSHFYFQQAVQEFEGEVHSFRQRGNIDEN
jgi:hypothetical protein